MRAFQLLFGCAWAVFAFVSPASADVLISNIGQSTASGVTASGNDFAQGFTTGSNTAGYTLENVEIEFNNARNNTTGLTVRLATGLPSSVTVVATMTNPSSISVGANNTFTAPSGTTLTASTTYYVVITGAAQDIRHTQSDNEDSGAAAGWNILDNRYWKRSDSSSWNSSGNALKIRINGALKTGTAPTTPAPAPDTTAPTLTGAVAIGSTLTLTFNEALDTTGNKPATSAFSISGAQSATSITAVNFRTGNSRIVDLTLNREIEEGETGVTITYTPPGTNDLQDSAGNKVATFTRAVVTTSEAVRQTAASILTSVGTQALSSALENIGGRLGDSLPKTDLSIAGFQVPPVSGETDQGVYEHCRFGCDTRSDRSGYHSIDSDDLLQSSAFSLSLGANEGKTDLSSLDWSVWGRVGLAAFEGRPEPDGHYDGLAKSGWFGIDGRTDEWVAGAALSKTWSETDYRTEASTGSQRMKADLTVLYPYGRWALDERSAMHVIAGIGSGEVRNLRDGSVEEKSDLSMRMLSVGVERQLAPRPDGMELSARVEASTVRLKTEAGSENIDGLTPESWRIRMGLEGSRRISRDDGTVMEPFFNLAVRHDGGDGLEGYGLEAAGGARYTDARVQLEFRGRVLVAHSGRGVRESGLSVTVQYLPESDGRGLSLSFRPHWGIAANGADALWRDEMPKPEQLSDASSFDARIGYGFNLPSTGGVVTPFAENMHSGGSRSLRVGARFDAPRDNLAMELSGERHRNAEDAVSVDSIRFDFSLRF